ncbi:MAG: BrnT family toxin [Phormidesmis sp.]
MFEYDPEESAQNKLKHGIDFEQAQQIWHDAQRAEISANSTIESRFMVIGRLGGKHWSAIITYREDNIRIISVRRSRSEEVEIYGS